jgi:hypothetical protein
MTIAMTMPPDGYGAPPGECLSHISPADAMVVVVVVK